jgi:hypothetical protein
VKIPGFDVNRRSLSYRTRKSLRCLPPIVLICASILMACLLWAPAAVAQEMPVDHHTMSHDAAWTWTADGNAFFGYNAQLRQFLDYRVWESQNWLMLSGRRMFGRGALDLTGMFSGERLTMQRKGSPQLFQTGETYQQQPLVNYQHPHDLFMGVGATYRITAGRARYIVGADLVGAPTLGPTGFMHRESARDNPQVPLTHHFLDSTHSTPGVVRGGIEVGPLTLESSVFRGSEPDENRLNIERPRLDSWAARAQYQRGAWHAQVSGGHMHEPEWYEPYDVTRITASLSFDGSPYNRPMHVTLAWGGNREFNGFNGNADGYLAEGTIGLTGRSSLYGRAEVADKDVLGVSPHVKGQSHRHVFYKIRAGTLGYVHEVSDRWGRMGIGADVTLYHIPGGLQPFWGGSRSFHAFLRWRSSTSHAHMD